MPAAQPAETTRTLNVAIIGNPNTGKSTLFNALAGMQSRVGNFPGVTVEKKVGKVRWNGQKLKLVDLPGTYSLSPRSRDEMVSVDVLLGRQRDVGAIDAVVCIVDASNLERNLYLVSQVLDVGLPTVLVLNMCDVCRQRGSTIDADALAKQLGIPVVSTEAHRRKGLEEVRQAIVETARAASPSTRPKPFPPEFYAECEMLERQLVEWGDGQVPFYLVERMLLDAGGHVESYFAHRLENGLPAYLADARGRLKEAGCRVPAVEARVRYAWARKMLAGVVTHPPVRLATASDKIDRVLTHRVAGLFAFAAMMFIVFQAIYKWAEPVMGYFESGQGFLGGLVEGAMVPGALRSLLVDGVIAGVGGVLVFLPQIVFLFFFIALLEDCGYMARAAFLMDKLMTRIGLSGKSFVPLMSSFACAIPGVMATRVIENRRDRMITILIAPLMSCSARLPVYLLLIAAFIPQTTYLHGAVGLQGLVLFGMYSLGALVAIPIAWLLKKTFFRGETPPFVMELPSYKWPSPRIVLHRVYDRGKAFVTRAGTLIFATTIVVWACGYFPGDHSELDRVQAQIETLNQAVEDGATESESPSPPGRESASPSPPGRGVGVRGDLQQDPSPPAPLPDGEGRIETAAADQTALDDLIDRQRHLSSELMANSILGRVGHAIEPAVKPLGWDWKIGVGVIASFPAREVIIATLGTIYSLGGEVDEEDEGLKGTLQSATWPDGRKVYNVPVALSIMVFFALCAQCAATLMVIKRETNSWFWPVFTFTYMTALAYLGALATYQIGMMFV